MLYKKFQTFAQIVGFVTIGLLAVLGLLSLFNGGNLALAALGLAQAAPQTTAPQVMNYQGILKDAAGDPLNGTYTITFRIYDSEIGGTALWEETHDRYIGVTVEPYTEMTPRQRIASVPYAFYADSAFQAEHTDRAYGLSAPDDDPVDAVTVDNNGNTAFSANVKIPMGGLCIDSDGACSSPGDGGLRANGSVYLANNTSTKVGIGTTSPGSKLSVIGTVRAAHDTAETEYIEITHGGSNGYINTVGDGNLDFRHDGDTKMSLSDAGDLDVDGGVNVGGDISWSGHLMNMTVTAEKSVFIFGKEEGEDGVKSITLEPVANSICFIVGVKLADIDSGYKDEHAACFLDQSGGNWILSANVHDDKDNYAYCEARCLVW